MLTLVVVAHTVGGLFQISTALYSSVHYILPIIKFCSPLMFDCVTLKKLLLSSSSKPFTLLDTSISDQPDRPTF